MLRTLKSVHPQRKTLARRRSCATMPRDGETPGDFYD
jgi:hypothetical protein